MRSFSHAQIREISLPSLTTANFIARKQMWKIPSEPQNLGKVGRQLASLILVRKRKTTQTFTSFQAFISSYEQSKKDLQLCVSCLMTMSSLLLWLCERGVKTLNKKIYSLIWTLSPLSRQIILHLQQSCWRAALKQDHIYCWSWPRSHSEQQFHKPEVTNPKSKLNFKSNLPIGQQIKIYFSSQ